MRVRAFWRKPRFWRGGYWWVVVNDKVEYPAVDSFGPDDEVKLVQHLMKLYGGPVEVMIEE